jgi:hypothetical protein
MALLLSSRVVVRLVWVLVTPASAVLVYQKRNLVARVLVHHYISAMGRPRKYKSNEPKRMVVKLEQDEWSDFKEAVDFRGTTPTEAVRQFVQRYIKRNKSKGAE